MKKKQKNFSSNDQCSNRANTAKNIQTHTHTRGFAVDCMRSVKWQTLRIHDRITNRSTDVEKKR